MKKISSIITIMFLLTFALSCRAQSPRSGETHIAYEMDIYNESSKSQNAGISLNGPGDTYRYTYFINDKYYNDADYTLVRATIGVHLLDPDYTKETGDMQKEWGRILINNMAQTWIHFPQVKNYRLGQTPEHTNLIELESDDEHNGMPPYIFDVTKHIKKNDMLSLQITNLREDGSIGGTANFGNFTFLRAGLHLYYVKTPS